MTDNISDEQTLRKVVNDDNTQEINEFTEWLIAYLEEYNLADKDALISLAGFLSQVTESQGSGDLIQPVWSVMAGWPQEILDEQEEYSSVDAAEKANLRGPLAQKMKDYAIESLAGYYRQYTEDDDESDEADDE